MSRVHPRREFLRTSAALGIGYWIAAGEAAEVKPASPNEQIAMASIGIGGKGESDSADAARLGRMVAICDTDEQRLNHAGEKRFPGAKRFTDFRKMLDEMHGQIDAVTVSTADHTHAPAALMAMRLGKHCFCQKPLTRTIYEARLMGQVAREKKLATQMGNQGSASSGLRRGAALLRAGALGKVRELHVWTDRPIWPQGVSRKEPKPAPKGLNWDAWIGPAPERPYADGYQPFVWRGWWDFGTGALGDIGCHAINMAFMGLDLRSPVTVEAQTSGHNKDSFPAWSIVTFRYAPTPAQPDLKLVWYDGGKVPPAEALDGKAPGTGGFLAIGDKGRMWGESLYAGAVNLDVKFPQSPGHFEEWVRAIRGGEPPVSNFPDHAGPLTEMVLLGNLAVWNAVKDKSDRIEYDAAAMKVKNLPGFESLIKPTYRKGYTLE